MRWPAVTRADLRFAGLVLGLALGELAVEQLAGGSTRLVEVAAVVVAGSLFALRRSAPLPAALVGVGALLVAGALSGPGDVPGAFYGLVAAYAYALGAYAETVPSVIGLVAVVAGLETVASIGHDDTFVPQILATVPLWFAGRAIRERRGLVARLDERAAELETEREEFSRLSVRYERAQIASELHDIVAHAIAVMVVQAGAGQRLAVDDAAEAAGAFDAIAEAAGQAEADMRRLVALLGDEDAPAETADLALVEGIVARAAGTGLDVSCRWEGARDGLTPEAAHTVCRVVQEGLTNALRYAPGAGVRILVAGGTEALTVEVLNGPPVDGARGPAGAGTGNGLRGLHERAAACRGTFSAGPTDDGGWRLLARLPRRAGVVEATDEFTDRPGSLRA